MAGYRMGAASDSEQVSATAEQDTKITLMCASASAPQGDQAPLVNMHLLAEHNRWHHGGRGRRRCDDCGGCTMCGAADARLTRPGSLRLRTAGRPGVGGNGGARRRPTLGQSGTVLLSRAAESALPLGRIRHLTDATR